MKGLADQLDLGFAFTSPLDITVVKDAKPAKKNAKPEANVQGAPPGHHAIEKGAPPGQHPAAPQPAVEPEAKVKAAAAPKATRGRGRGQGRGRGRGNLFRRLQAVARQPMLRIPALRQRQRLRLLNQQQQQHNQASLPQSAVASASRRASNWGVPSVTGAKWDALLAGRKLV